MPTELDRDSLRQLDRCRVPHDTGAFTFTKNDRRGYWVVKGPVPLHVAQAIYADAASGVIRVAGHCGCVAPADPWLTWRMPNGTILATEEEGIEFVRLAERHLWALDAMRDYTFSDDPAVRARAKSYVDSYHIDTEMGLRVFVDYLRWNGVLR